MSFKFDIVILKAHKVQMLMCYKNKKGLSEIRKVTSVSSSRGRFGADSQYRTDDVERRRTNAGTTERSKRAKGLA